MRWTLDSVEFYRYVPKEEPAARSFNDVSGVIVDVIYFNVPSRRRRHVVIESNEPFSHLVADAKIELAQRDHQGADEKPHGPLSVRGVGGRAALSHADQVGADADRCHARDGARD